MKRLILTFSFFVSVFAISVYAKDSAIPQNKPSIFGVWETERIPEENENDIAYIKILPCDSNPKKACGKIIWTEIQIDPETGKTPLDKFNPNERLRTRPILCIQTLSGFEPTEEENTYTNGILYSPRSGNSYEGIAVLTGPDQLKLEGTILFGLLSRSTTWKRVKKPVPNPCGS